MACIFRNRYRTDESHVLRVNLLYAILVVGGIKILAVVSKIAYSADTVNLYETKILAVKRVFVYASVFIVN